MTLAERYGPWALVVGGAHGIGAAFCDQLAEAGLSVAVVDRDPAGLEAKVHSLEASGATALGIPAELGPEPCAPALLEALGDREVGLLVCNAAASSVGPFLDIPLQDHLQALDVNCRAAVELAHVFGGRFAARGRGGIVLLASLAAFQGTPRVASYAASKAYLLVLGEALGEELRPRGVDTLVVAPGAVRTPAYLATQPVGDAGGVMEPEAVVKEALSALGRRPLVVPGRSNRAVRALLGRVLSRPAAVRLLGRAMAKRYPSE